MLTIELFKIAVPLGFVLGMALAIYQSINKGIRQRQQAREIESARPKFERTERDGES